MKIYVLHLGEAELDDGTQIQRMWVITEETAAAIAQSLGPPMQEYVASFEQARIIGDSMTEAGVATFENR